jgi:hypothetical protein
MFLTVNNNIHKLSDERRTDFLRNDGQKSHRIDQIGKELDRLYAEERQTDAKARRTRACPFWRARAERRERRRARSS